MKRAASLEKLALNLRQLLAEADKQGPRVDLRNWTYRITYMRNHDLDPNITLRPLAADLKLTDREAEQTLLDLMRDRDTMTKYAARAETAKLNLIREASALRTEKPAEDAAARAARLDLESLRARQKSLGLPNIYCSVPAARIAEQKPTT